MIVFIWYDDFMLRFFEYEPLQQFVNDPGNEHDNSSCINNVHHFQVKAGWPVGVFLSEKIHVQT